MVSNKNKLIDLNEIVQNKKKVFEAKHKKGTAKIGALQEEAYFRILKQKLQGAIRVIEEILVKKKLQEKRKLLCEEKLENLST